jgi:hypothetical protein
MSGRIIPASLLSFISSATSLVARAIDYRLAETPLSFLSFGRIMLFKKLIALQSSKLGG